MRRDPFHALSDPTRRAILILIAAQALTPNAIAEHFDTTRQAVANHIKILDECELLKKKKDGRETYYQLEIEKLKEVDMWLAQLRNQWESRMSQLGGVLKNLKSK
jgi:DNA-binding transcriptional ArsR family regulator